MERNNRLAPLCYAREKEEKNERRTWEMHNYYDNNDDLKLATGKERGLRMH